MNLFGYKKFTDYANIRNLVIISPIFFLTIRHWTDSIVIVACVASLNFFWEHRNSPKNAPKKLIRSDLFVGLALAGPFIAVVIGQLFRLELYTPNLDAPLRMVLCIPIFLAIRRGWLRGNNSKFVGIIWIESIIPIALVWTFFFRIYWPTSWGVNLTTYFVDPLTFGSYCLLFSILSVIGLTHQRANLEWYSKLLSVFGAFCGVYLSLTSGSRTGWASLPIFLMLWTTLFLRPRLSRRPTTLIVALVLTVLTALAMHESHLVEKFLLAMKEISEYEWNSMNPDTSVGMRISFYRMGYYYFTQKPISGWGDLGWMELMNSPQLAIYASDFARRFPKHGFHNEIVTSAVRSGVWGLISACLFYLVFMIENARTFLSSKNSQIKALSFASLIFVIHLFIAGMTTEIINLIFLASFIGLTLAVLTGDQLEN